MKKTIIEFVRCITDGGAETLIKDYALLIDKNHFDVKIIALFCQKNSANYKTLQQNNIKIYTIYEKWNKTINIFNKLFGRVFVPIKLCKILKEEDVSVIHSHMTVLKYLVPISNMIKNIKLFYTCHSIPERYFSGMQKEEYYAAKYLIKKNQLQLIGLHKNMADELNNLFSVNNTVVIQNGIDFNRFKHVEETKKQIREEIGIPKEAFVLGHVGRFHPIKNHKFIVEVFRVLKEKKKNSFLVMVGDGGETSDIIELLNNYKLNESYLILANRSDIPRIMKAMDVFIFPSIAEGLGIALIEAQVCKLKCVVSDTVPSAAFLTDLVFTKNLQEPVENWVDVILKEEIRGTYSGDIEKYDMNKEIKKLESLYND